MRDEDRVVVRAMEGKGLTEDRVVVTPKRFVTKPLSSSEKHSKSTTTVAVVTMEVGGRGTLSEVHQSAKKLLLRCRYDLERPKHSTSTSAAVVGIDSELSFAVKRDINQIQCLRRSVASKPQHDVWKR